MITKVYEISHLVSTQEEILWRTSSIEKLTHKLLAPTYFEHTLTQIKRHTKSIKKTSIQYGNLNEEQLLELANILDECFSINLVHGDINKKNVFLNEKSKIVISDWEPSLTQIVNNKTSLMGTFPWMDINDLKKKKITFRTDILCFYKIITNCPRFYFMSNSWNLLIKNALSSKMPFKFILNFTLSCKQNNIINFRSTQ
jgi:serine/threonine protein kinase